MLHFARCCLSSCKRMASPQTYFTEGAGTSSSQNCCDQPDVPESSDNTEEQLSKSAVSKESSEDNAGLKRNHLQDLDVDETMTFQACTAKRWRSHAEMSPPSEAQAEYERKKQQKLLHRRWYFTHLGRTTNRGVLGRYAMEFTVASYNILAQNLLIDNEPLYRNTDDRFLSWEFRSANLLREIQARQPDVLCLQEVMQSSYEEYFSLELGKLGYKGQYVKRTGDKQDGCATFYKTSKFLVDECVPVHYHREGYDLLNRDNVGLITLLRPLVQKTNAVCVANTHLLFNPGRGDIKLIQLQLLFAEIDKLIHYTNTTPTKHPVILCGDFNSVPFSYLYDFVVGGNLDYAGLQSHRISGQELKRSSKTMGSLLLPPQLGISDQCQYVDVYCERLMKSQLVTSVGSRTSENCGSLQPTGITHPLVTTCNVAVATQVAHHPPETSDSQTVPYLPPAETRVEEEDPNCVQSSGRLSQNLNLVSVYDHEYFMNQGKKKVSELTTCHSRAKETVDYIFYSVIGKDSFFKRHKLRVKNVNEGSLKLLGKLNLLTKEDMEEFGKLPNNVISSDHFMLMAKFHWHFDRH